MTTPRPKREYTIEEYRRHALRLTLFAFCVCLLHLLTGGSLAALLMMVLLFLAGVSAGTVATKAQIAGAAEKQAAAERYAVAREKTMSAAEDFAATLRRVSKERLQ